MLRDFMEGERAVKSRDDGEKYLPRLDGQSDDNYRAYRDRTKFFPATFRTLDALLGLLFRQDPVNRLTPAIDAEWKHDVDRRGTSLKIFQKQAAEEVLSIGRAGVLVDVMPGSDEPHLVLYSAEHIIDWITDRGKLVSVTLWESADHYRVLSLIDGQYWQTILHADDDGSVTVVNEIQPLRAGQPLDRLPFFPLGWRDNDIEIDKPPLIDLCWLNLHHYQMSAPYANANFIIGVPQPYGTGYAPPMPEGSDGPPKIFIALSSEEMPFFEDAEARLRYLEHNGTGLGHLRDMLRDIKDEMATIGVRMLAQERLPQETATSARIHRMSEISVLSGISRNLSDAFTRILDMVTWWIQDAGSNESILGTEFFPVQHTADDLLKFAELYRDGAITFEEFHRKLIEADVRSAEMTVEQALTEAGVQETTAAADTGGAGEVTENE